MLGDQISNAYVDAQRSIGNFSPEPVSVGDLFAGALFPGLMLVGMYIAYQAVVAWLRPLSSPAIPREELDDAGSALFVRVMHALVPPVVLIVAVLGSILAGVATPTEAAAVGAVGATLLAGLRVPSLELPESSMPPTALAAAISAVARRLDPNNPTPIYTAGLSLVLILVLQAFVDLRVLREEIPAGDMLAIWIAALGCLGVTWGFAVSILRVAQTTILTSVVRSTMEITSMVFVILIGAAVFSLVFRGLGGDDLVHGVLSSMPGGIVGEIITVMVVMFILGFFLDFIEITFVVVPIVAPVLLQSDISPVWLGIMMAMNLQTSFLTPPFGFALFYLRGVAPPEVTTMHIYNSPLIKSAPSDSLVS